MSPLTLEDRYWAVTGITQWDFETGIWINITTNHPCHLWMFWSHINPYIKKGGAERRGSVICWLFWHAIHNQQLIEQVEWGDSYSHTFIVAPWPDYQTRWFFFHGRHEDLWSPSNSPIFRKQKLPGAITAFFYPDAHPEVSSVDGEVISYYPGEGWAKVHGGPGNFAFSNSENGMVCIQAYHPIFKYAYIQRQIYLFDTSSIPVGATIITANLRLFITQKIATLFPDPTWVVVRSYPDSNTELIPLDYQTMGDTPLSDIKAHENIQENAFNTWFFNDTGLAEIVKGGVTKLGLREYSKDCLNHEPAWLEDKAVALFTFYSEKGGDVKARLAVTYQP